MRVFLHYLSAFVIIPFYGIQVCPFLESLPPLQVIIPVGVAMALQAAIRIPLRARLVDNQPLKLKVRRAYWLEAALFLSTALLLMVFNTIVHGFPLVSGLKVLVGLAGLGFFAAIDLGLAEERRVAEAVESGHGTLEPDTDPFPMTRKVALFASISIGVLISIFMLLVIKDLDWIVEVGKTMPLAEARVSIIKEFLFVLIVVLPHTLNIIRSYALNLKYTLGNQTTLLSLVTAGDYSSRVPVTSNDEFGLIAQHTNTMVDRVQDQVTEISRTRDVTILSLATLAEIRDNETGEHILRTQRYVRVLANQLKDHPNFSATLNDEIITLMFKSAPLHDIGKVGIPDAILLKPGKLTDEEFTIMKTHASLGAEALNVAKRELGDNSFLRFAREIALTHHEKWDGSGYPQGLSGSDIPLSGRLMAVADVYDALISKRVYKPAFSHDKAVEIIREGRGSHFDPDVVDAMDATEDQFKAVADQYSSGST